MTIFVLGNQDLKEDSTPLKMLPEIRKHFPRLRFEVKDPNEEWDIPEELVIIDTVVGKNEITIFSSLSEFAPAPRLTMHDFDALANLRYLEKLGRLKKIKIIGIPQEFGLKEATDGVVDLLSRVLQDQGITAGI